MKVKLLKKTRKRAYIRSEANGMYRPIISSGMFDYGAEGNLKETKKEAQASLNEMIVYSVFLGYKRNKAGKVVRR